MRRLLLLVSAIVFTDTVFFAAITPLLPSYAEDFALSKSAAGVLAATYPAGTFVGALPGGWLAARFGVRRTVLLGLAGMIAASLACEAFGDWLPYAVGAAACLVTFAVLHRARHLDAGREQAGHLSAPVL